VQLVFRYYSVFANIRKIRQFDQSIHVFYPKQTVNTGGGLFEVRPNGDQLHYIPGPAGMAALIDTNGADKWCELVSSPNILKRPYLLQS